MRVVPNTLLAMMKVNWDTLRFSLLCSWCCAESKEDGIQIMMSLLFKNYEKYKQMDGSNVILQLKVVMEMIRNESLVGHDHEVIMSVGDGIGTFVDDDNGFGISVDDDKQLKM